MSRWIPVLVRVEDLTEVTGLIARLESARTDQGFEPEVVVASSVTEEDLDRPILRTGADTELGRRPVWSLVDLARLGDGLTDTTSRWARAMDFCATRPGTYFPTSEVARGTGMSLAEWRDAPRKITRHLNKHYPDVPRDHNDNPVWPLHGLTRPEHPGEVSWAISRTMADLWWQVRDTAAGDSSAGGRA